MAKKKKRTIEDLRAYDNAYGRKLTTGRQFKLSVEPAIILVIVATLMWMRPVMSVIFFVVGLTFGYFRIMPRQVRVEYEQSALEERHKAVSTMASAMTAGDKLPAYRILQRVSATTTGELHDDFMRLTAAVLSFESEGAVHKAFVTMMDKYKGDVYFVQFLEQLETFALSSTMDIQTIEMLNDMHNTLVEKSIDYTRIREGSLQETRIMTGVVIALGVMMEFVAVKMATYKYFVQYFWHGMTGWITGALMIVLFSVIFYRFYNRYFDTSITEF